MSSYTETLHGKEARKALKKGIDQVALPVKKSMGAKGLNSVYYEYNSPTVTNDGVSIARRIIPQDQFERLGADLIKQASEKTNLEAGDGTSSTICLAHALIENGIKELNRSFFYRTTPLKLRQDLQKYLPQLVEDIKSVSHVLTKEDIYRIAYISVEDQGLAELVDHAFAQAGTNGQVFVDEYTQSEIEVEYTPGYHYNKGFTHPYFINNHQKQEVALTNPAVLVTDRYFNLNSDLINALNQVKQAGNDSVVIIADKVDGELLATLLQNKEKGLLNPVVVTRPDTDEELEDIAKLTGATAITQSKKVKVINASHFGTVDKVVVTKDKITFVTEERRPELVEHIANLQEEADENRERIAKLTDGVVLIKVGAKTESERRYIKLKLDDAVGAVNAAKEEGYVPGAGYTLYNLSLLHKSLPVWIQKSLQSTYKQILDNAGIAPDGAMWDVSSMTYASHKLVIDPAKVVRCSVENAFSVASSFLSIESATAIHQEKAD